MRTTRTEISHDRGYALDVRLREIPSRSGTRSRAGERPQSSRCSLYLDRQWQQPGRDVICAGMYRACSTWQYEVVGHLVENHLKGQRLGYVCGETYETLERLGPGRKARGGSTPWRVLKSHEGARSFSRALESSRALAVYVFRDLREVIFSLIHKRGTSFRQLLRQGMIHQLLANDRFWRSQPRVLVQRYEDLVDDPVTGVVQLARHLGLGVARREAAAIAEEYSLASNRTRIETLRRKLLEAGIDLHDPANHQICDSTTLLHWNHLRLGRAGSWQADATPDQRALMRTVCDPWLLANGYKTTSELESSDRGGPAEGMEDAPNGHDITIGRIAFILRNATGRYPRATRRLKRLLGLRGRSPGTMIAWPVEAAQF